MKLTEYPDREIMMINVADRLASELRDTLRHSERATLAVPGGTTPGPVFESLSALELEWDRVDVVLTDERWVPESSERSNTRLVRERLLTGPAAAATLLPLYAEGAEPEERLGSLAAAIEPALPISVLLLGMGTDMHTASLVPGGDRLAEALDDDAPVLVAIRSPALPEPRVTLSAPVLRGAINIHLLITGREKREALDRAMKLHDPMQAPVAAVLRNAVVHWAE